MDDMINRHDSIAEENIEPNGRPAKDQFGTSQAVQYKSYPDEPLNPRILLRCGSCVLLPDGSFL